MTEVDNHLRESLLPEGPNGQLSPSCYDAWQAASLLIGLYGVDAVDYAGERKIQMHEIGDLAGARTWDLIVAQVLRLLRTAPGSHLN